MAVVFKAVDNRTSISKKIKAIEQDLAEFRDEFLRGMSQEVVLNSPVDTGTYITSHEIVAGVVPSGGATNSKGKARNQPYQPYAQMGINQLYQDIELLPEASQLTAVSIFNTAEHAANVEYDLGYAPYTIARDKANIIASDAEARTRGR